MVLQHLLTEKVLLKPLTPKGVFFIMVREMDGIRVKTLYRGWVNVTEDQARKWTSWNWNHGFTACGWTYDKKRDYLSKRVEGIDIDLLLEGLK